MTTREQIIAAAEDCNAFFNVIAFGRRDGTLFSFLELEKFYAIAYEAGRVAEREETNRRPLPDNTAPYIRAREERKK